MRVICTLSLLLSLFQVWVSPAVAAITCTDPTYDCVEWSDGELVGGINIGRHCARYAGRQDCVDSDPINQCTALQASAKCERTNRECVDYKNGACRQWRERFSCLNENENMAPAVLTSTEFGPTQENIINQCSEYEGRSECELVNTRTTEGAEIRDINRKDFSRSWWKRERTYSCLAPGEGDNTCGPLESDPTCTLQGATCLVENANGVCSNREFHYTCGVQSGDLETSCEPINVCVGDNCMGIEQETSSDFGSSAAWLNVLAQMQRDYRAQAATDPNDVRFFTGTKMTCSKAPGRNCCSTGGIFGSTCPESAAILRDKRAAGSTHYVGVTCQQKVLGHCVKKRYHYCTFNSKFGRVFVEEFKKQVEEGWGTPHASDCGSVTIEDFGNVDIEEMDLSEVFGDIMGTIQLPVSEGIQDFFEDRFPDAEGDASGAFEEVGQ
ncbi:conjugal transfer protein TraN [Tritonibacter scottomollicae]|uniref:Type IV conjugative transfer system TraN protein involved in mating pair stabilization n=1 Tax=Tritonibacter scottomollicae TaxID=483013 RepID=A0A2T1AAF6_TRISK|nr:conjugal transfer protein TraN [Tritonibacter scottomollicae]PRZ45593.1 type IV conjugative transfer system TraN protein involved in mating pair stabilization [Tritonibacter scottomollicae]